MKRLLIAIAMASTLLAANAFAGPSAKFAATWNYGIDVVSIAYVSEDFPGGDFALDLESGYQLATIKVPQDKELLVGVSAEIGLVTDTSVKGKKGGGGRAVAGAGAGVIIFAIPQDHGSFEWGRPGFVMLNSRLQVLDATLGGVLAYCTDINGDGTIQINTECRAADEEIGLFMGTLSANHFNFVLPNMDQGEYDIVAFFVTGALAAVDTWSVIPGGSSTAEAGALAFIGKTMLTVQQVRGTPGGVVPFDIED
jgi:hypothetical protein